MMKREENLHESPLNSRKNIHWVWHLFSFLLSSINRSGNRSSCEVFTFFELFSHTRVNINIKNCWKEKNVSCMYAQSNCECSEACKIRKKWEIVADVTITRKIYMNAVFLTFRWNMKSCWMSGISIDIWLTFFSIEMKWKTLTLLIWEWKRIYLTILASFLSSLLANAMWLIC